MKNYLLALSAVSLLAGCDARVNVPAGEDKTTIVNPAAPAKENNTTIINPSSAPEKKVENNTTVVNPPASSGTSVEKSSTTTTTSQ